jgi:hypothetical protein
MSICCIRSTTHHSPILTTTYIHINTPTIADGALTGLSKKMVKQKYGHAQFMKWRRGFKVKKTFSGILHCCFCCADDTRVSAASVVQMIRECEATTHTI